MNLVTDRADLANLDAPISKCSVHPKLTFCTIVAEIMRDRAFPKSHDFGYAKI